MDTPSLSQTAKSAATQGSEALRVLAQDIRVLRKARGLTLNGLAQKLGRSVGWMSQVERGITLPSFGDLKALAHHFSVPVSLFVADPPANDAESGVVVRAGKRRRLAESDTGIVDELLSPDLGGSFQMLRSSFAPGSTAPEAQPRAGEEAGYVVAGIVEIEIAGAWHRLVTGDSFRLREQAFRWRNPGPETAVIIRVISPPAY